jgi:tryptophanyl-tRNA synthetase
VRFLELFLPAPRLAQWKERLRAGGRGRARLRPPEGALIEAVDATFAPARARRQQLLAEPGESSACCAPAPRRPRARARATVDRCYEACGLR